MERNTRENGRGKDAEKEEALLRHRGPRLGATHKLTFERHP